jgi:hypothetical protein
MRKVARYETRDGKVFDCPREAKQYEALLEGQQKLTELLKISLANGRAESVVRQILMEHLAVVSILKCHAKKLPKG